MGKISSEINLEEKRKEYEELLKKSVEMVVEKLKDKVERINIFGSYSRGKSDLFTDLDIIIIMKTEKPFLERLRDIYSLLALPVDAEILCYTPEEFEEMKKKGFLRR